MTAKKYIMLLLASLLLSITLSMNFADRILELSCSDQFDKRPIEYKKKGAVLLLHKVKSALEKCWNLCFICFKRNPKSRNKVYKTYISTIFTRKNTRAKDKTRSSKIHPEKEIEIVDPGKMSPSCIKRDFQDDNFMRKSVKFQVKSNSEIFDLDRDNLHSLCSPIIRPHKEKDDVVFLINEKIKILKLDLQNAKEQLNNTLSSKEIEGVNNTVYNIYGAISSCKFMKKEYLSKVCSIEETKLHVSKSISVLETEKSNELAEAHTTYGYYLTKDRIYILKRIVDYIIDREEDVKYQNTVCFSPKKILTNLLKKEKLLKNVMSTTIVNPNQIPDLEKDDNASPRLDTSDLPDLKEKIAKIQDEYNIALTTLQQYNNIVKEMKNCIMYFQGMEDILSNIKVHNEMKLHKDKMIEVKENLVNEKFECLTLKNKVKLKQLKDSVFNLKDEYKKKIHSLPKIRMEDSKESIE